MSNYTELSKERLELLQPDNVRHRLCIKGWVAEPYVIYPSKAVIFTHKTFPGTDLLLPIDRRFSDFALRMYDLVVDIALCEERPAIDVLDELLSDWASPPEVE